MALKMKEFSLGKFGPPSSNGKAIRAEVSIRMIDSETNREEGVFLDVFVPREDETTIAQLEATSRAQAVVILKAALEAISASDPNI